MVDLKMISVRHPFAIIEAMFHVEPGARRRARAQSQEPGGLMSYHRGFPVEEAGVLRRSRVRAELPPYSEHWPVLGAALNHYHPIYQRDDVQVFEKRTPLCD